MFALAFRMLRNQSDAEEVVQETLLKLWKMLGEWEFGKAKVETWAYRVVYNHCIDKLRRANKFIAEEVDDNQPAPTLNPEQNLMQDQLKSEFATILEQLPSRQKSAIILTYYEGLNAKEAGAIMDISVDALESLLARAKRKLKTLLNPQILGDGIVN